MAFVAAVVMIAGGLVAAVIVMGAFALNAREARGAARRHSPGGSSQEIAASILFQVARSGGMGPEEAFRLLRKQGMLAQVTREADLVSWAREYARVTGPAERAWLLEAAVRAAVESAATIPLPQYNALLDLSFSLGFQTDALARLRARYRFEYIDYAKRDRPRSAERGGPALYSRAARDRTEALRLLELEPPVTRQRLMSAYRRLAAAYHPDRYHNAAAPEREQAAERFIRLTEVYEQLLPECDED